MSSPRHPRARSKKYVFDWVYPSNAPASTKNPAAPSLAASSRSMPCSAGCDSLKSPRRSRSRRRLRAIRRRADQKVRRIGAGAALSHGPRADATLESPTRSSRRQAYPEVGSDGGYRDAACCEESASTCSISSRGRWVARRSLRGGLSPRSRSMRPDLDIVCFCGREAGAELPDPEWSDRVRTVVLPVDAARKPSRLAVELTRLPRTAAREGVQLLHSLGTTAPLHGPFARVPLCMTSFITTIRLPSRRRPGSDSRSSSHSRRGGRTACRYRRTRPAPK